MKDERIEQAKNKIRSEMTVLIIWGVAISFLVKTLVFKMSLQQCLTEYLILVLAPVYQFIRMHTLKVVLYKDNSDNRSLRKLVMAIIFVAVAASVYFVDTTKYYSQGLPIIQVLFLVIFIALVVFLSKFNNRRGLKYEREYDDD